MGIISLIGAGVSYYGERQRAKAAEKTAEYNANLSRSQAKGDVVVMEENMRRKADENSRFMASQRAQLAKAGLSVAGTPLAVLGETESLLDRDIADMSVASAGRTRSLHAQADMGLFEGYSQAAGMRTAAFGQLVSSTVRAGTEYGQASGFLASRKTTTTSY